MAAAGQRSSRSWTKTRLPVDLAIFWPPDHHGAHMHPGPGEGSHPGEGFGMGGFVGVVRECQVGAPGVQVDRGPEGRERHGRALGVPAGPSRSPRARPRRLVTDGAHPQSGVERVVLVRVVGVSAALRLASEDCLLAGLSPAGLVDSLPTEVD